MVRLGEVFQEATLRVSIFSSTITHSSRFTGMFP